MSDINLSITEEQDINVTIESGNASNFISLLDTPIDYSGNSGYFVKVNEDEDGLEFSATSSAISELSDIEDVTTTSVVNGEILVWNTNHWENNTLAEAGISATGHTHTASDITDFDTEVSNNSDVSANTSARHDALTVTDSSEIDFTLTGQDLTASIISGSIDESKLDASVNASLDLADSALQSFTETDPVFIASEAFNIDADDITNLSNLSGTNTGDQDISGIATNASAISDIEAKTDFITVTQAVDLDTMESNIATNNAKVSFTWDYDYNDLINTPTIPTAVSDLTNDSGYITATLTNEQVQDIVGAMFSGNTETRITATYQDGDGTIDLVVDNDLSNYDNSTSGFVQNLSDLGITATAAELNKLDGVTATTTEINYVDGVTSSIQTQLNTKAPIANPTFTGEIGIGAVNVSETELGILEGATVTTTELNKLDGFTGTYIDLNYAKDLRATGVTTTEFDKLDGLTATTTELNYTDGVTSNIQTQLNGKIDSDTSSDGVSGSDQITNIVSCTQSEYDAGTPDSTTIYIITD
jgi:hypothetical protein